MLKVRNAVGITLQNLATAPAPSGSGAIPKSFPDCGACNHLDLREHAPMEDGSVLTCRDCDDHFQVWAVSAE